MENAYCGNKFGHSPWQTYSTNSMAGWEKVKAVFLCLYDKVEDWFSQSDDNNVQAHG